MHLTNFATSLLLISGLLVVEAQVCLSGRTAQHCSQFLVCTMKPYHCVCPTAGPSALRGHVALAACSTCRQQVPGPTCVQRQCYHSKSPHARIPVRIAVLIVIFLRRAAERPPRFARTQWSSRTVLSHATRACHAVTRPTTRLLLASLRLSLLRR
jgi:hypothetical protein